MKAYFTFFKMRMLNNMQYRAAAWGGICCQFFWGFMEIQLYRAFYAEHVDSFPMAFPHLVSYLWLRQAFFSIINTFRYESELFSMILDGNVAYELCRPSSMYGMWYMRTIASRVGDAAMRFWPILLVAVFLPEPWTLHFAADPMTFVCFLLSMTLTLCVIGAFQMILYFSCFYTLSADGLRSILMPVGEFLSGGLIPLPFMPDWLSVIIKYSPYGAMANAPLRIYSGDIAGFERLETLLLQVFWMLGLIAIGYFMQRRGMRRLCVQGG